MARRLIVDNGWFRALCRDNVELVSDTITRIVPEGIELADGRVLRVDVILLATGFAVTSYLWPTQYVGPHGRRLEETWDAGDGPRAYLGIMAPEFPNLFVIYGPNSQARTGSLPSWIEVWTRYAASCVIKMIEGGHRRIAVRRDAFERYNSELDRACEDLVWGLVAVPTSNYYVHASGRQMVNCPWRAEDYYERLERPYFSDFELA
jgi:4-hydroxyacetophenone monooxygenase